MPKPRRSRLSRALIVVIGVMLLWAPGTVFAAGETSDEPVEAKTVTAPVVLDGELLFRVRGVPALPAEERARLIAERIRRVAADPGIAPNALRIAEGASRSDILAGDHRLATVVDADADIEDVDRSTLAMTNLQRIQTAIEAYRRDRSPEMLRWAAVRSAVALIALLVGAVLVVSLWRR